MPKMTRTPDDARIAEEFADEQKLRRLAEAEAHRVATFAAEQWRRGRRWVMNLPLSARMCLIDTAGTREEQTAAVARLEANRCRLIATACVIGGRGPATASVLDFVNYEAVTFLARAEAAIGKPVRLAF